MKVLSIDIAKAAGFALWDSGQLIQAGEICKQPRKKGLFQTVLSRPGSSWLEDDPEFFGEMTERQVWRRILGKDPFDSVEMLVIEAPYVHKQFPGTAIKLAEQHGRVVAHLGFETYSKVVKVEIDKWRAVAKRTLGAVWPKKVRGQKRDEAYKIESQRLVDKYWGVDAGHNVSDAILIGHWFNLSEHAPYTLPKSYPSQLHRPRKGVAARAA